MKYTISTAVMLLESVHMERVKEGCCERCGHKSRTYEQRPYWYKVQEGGKTLLRHNRKYVAYAHEREADERHERTPSRLRRDQPDELEWILAYLMAGDTDRFFDALRSDPELLLEKEIWDRTVGYWHKQKIFDTPEGEQARKHLRTVGSMLADPVGRPELPENQRKQSQQKRQLKAREYSTAANHRKAAKRLVTKVREQAIRNRSYGRTEKQAWMEAKREVLETWKETSQAHDKAAILKRVKEFLREN